MLNLLLIGLIILVISVVYMTEKRKRGLDLFSPYSVFLLMYLLFFGIKPLDMYLFREVPDDFTAALIYVAIGLLSFLFGYYMKIGTRLGRIIKPMPDKWEKTHVLTSIAMFAAAGMILYLLILRLTEIGSISGAYSNMWMFRFKAFSQGMAYLSLLTYFFLSASLVIWLTYLLGSDKVRYLFWLMFIAYLFCVLIVISSFGLRALSVAIIISLLLCYNYLKKKVSILWLAVFLIMVIVFVALMGQARNPDASNTDYGQLMSTASTIPAENYLEGFMGRIDAFPNFIYILNEFPTQTMDFRYGATFINFLFQPIPRALFPEKPYLIPDIYTQQYFPGDVGRVSKDPSIFGELYMNLHVGGIILGLMLLGIICRIFQVYIEKNSGNKGVILFYTLQFGFPASYLGPGFSSGATESFLFFLVIILIFLNIIKIRPKEPA